MCSSRIKILPYGWEIAVVVVESFLFLHLPDLCSAHQNELTGFTLLCNDTMGEQMGRGGEAVMVTITHKDKKDWWVFH